MGAAGAANRRFVARSTALDRSGSRSIAARPDGALVLGCLAGELEAGQDVAGRLPPGARHAGSSGNRGRAVPRERTDRGERCAEPGGRTAPGGGGSTTQRRSRTGARRRSATVRCSRWVATGRGPRRQLEGG